MADMIAVLGAGVLGRSVALRLQKSGHQVTLFDRHSLVAPVNASAAAAGMLAPVTESIRRHKDIALFGKQSIQELVNFCDEFELTTAPVLNGTLIACKGNQSSLVAEYRSILQVNGFSASLADPKIDGDLATCLSDAISVQGEGYIDHAMHLEELGEAYLKNGGEFIAAEVSRNHDGVTVNGRSYNHSFDKVVDCRGIAAQDELEDLRAVRGETIVLEAKDFTLDQTLRLLDVRHEIYLVPRPGGRFVLGAVEIEASNQGPTVESALDLLAQVYQLHPKLRQARVIGMHTGIRPAFSDNLPKLYFNDRVIWANGMYRHGFLMAPLMAKAISQFIEVGEWPDALKPWCLEKSACK